ncbi:outer membrane lipoprotein-sorting protein [bacterium E08(2017)]|nr:outer membrane lipoprotein-sorting protein [bacterium E08(2017)]
MNHRVIISTVLVTLIAMTVFADDMSVMDIITKADEASYYAGKDGKADVKMTIDDGKGNTRVREFTILRLNKESKDQKFYVYFKSPPDVRKMAYLVWKNVDGDDDRWLWLPALNLNKRIAPGDKRTSFVGSDFLYEDVSGRGVDEDTHELVGEEGDLVKIKSTPKDPDSVEFSYYMVWIDTRTFLPKKAEYYDKNDKLYRIVEALKVETIEGHPTVMEAVAKDLKSGSSTKNEFSNVDYDIGLNERIFTERFLRRPPREVGK